MRENEFTLPSKIVVGTTCAVGVPSALLAALHNATLGHVPHPWAFSVVLLGFTSFLVAKIGQRRRGVVTRFGPRGMGVDQLNAYRVGYWFMTVGILATFLP